MKAIRFLSDQIYETGGPGKGPLFGEGSILLLADVGSALKDDVTEEYAAGFLQRWVRRGVAVYVDPDADADEGDKGGDGTIDLEKLTVDQLKAHAASLAVDLGAATKKADIIAVIAAASKPSE